MRSVGCMALNYRFNSWANLNLLNPVLPDGIELVHELDFNTYFL
jgi:hypothetical protein